MDYNLAALKLLCSQLKESHEVQPNSESHPSFTLGSILFQRAWLQGILVSEPSSSSSDDTGRLFLDDGTGAIELLLSGDFRNRQWESGMYVMVVGGYFLRTDDLPIIKVHKIVDLSPFPDRESMWYLEVMEVFKRFYQPLSGY
ncbi:hypothetical protein M9H77_16354 [Catharanthus roseus]|uniref:Uncharacterized protein n=1 Tax=Catharanthus roseus TaxID=4058 RepID=A0ACC0B1J4_CATRO|nr:hypothetical protein M9H77_16354 [Catharanthus roseus]